jgi:hypothetical protein
MITALLALFRLLLVQTRSGCAPFRQFCEVCRFLKQALDLTGRSGARLAGWADRAALFVMWPFIQGTAMIRFPLTDSPTDTLDTRMLSRRDSRARRLARSLLQSLLISSLVATLASLVACGSSAASVATATLVPTAPSGPTATAVPAGTVLFQSDWSKGLTGWQASDGWTIQNGLLEMDGQDNRTLTIPYRPTARDYDVTFQVQMVSEPMDGGYFRLHAAPTPTAPGYQAGVFGLLTPVPHPGGDHPTASATLDPVDAQDPSSQHPSDFEPHNTMWTYHVEVRGNGVRLRRDTTTLSAAVAIKEDPLSQGPLRIECGLAFLRFGQITITAL